MARPLLRTHLFKWSCPSGERNVANVASETIFHGDNVGNNDAKKEQIGDACKEVIVTNTSKS